MIKYYSEMLDEVFDSFFIPEGSTIFSKPTQNPRKPADEYYTYEFSHWEPNSFDSQGNYTGVEVYQNTVFEANYIRTERQYTVTFENGFGETKIQLVGYNEHCIVPEDFDLRPR